MKLRTGLSRSSIYLQIAQGTFPASISLGGRAVGWVESEVEEWLSMRIAERGRRSEQDVFNSADTRELTKGPDDLVFRRADGEPWKHSNQKERVKEALKAAKITGDISFNNLRHTFASLLAMNKTPMPVNANQLGHTSTRMAEKHYAHLAPSYIGDVVRTNMPSYSDATAESKQAENESAQHSADSVIRREGETWD